jgi:ABC-type dipeptide/oligopeptide/nickel transport system permease subunit
MTDTAENTPEAFEHEEPRRRSNVGFRAFLRTLFKHKLSVIGIVIIILMFSMAAFAPLLAPYDPNAPDFYNLLKGPSAKHWLGTDDLGRDLLSRIIYGARISMTIGLGVTAFSLAFGTFMGLLSGFRGGVWDMVIMRVCDMIFIFPGFMFILIMAAALGPGMINIIIAISVFGWAGPARLVRGNVLSVRELPYVEAARASGASNMRIMLKYVLPNCLAPMIVAASLGLGGAVGMEAGAAFLGIGVQPPTPSWGRELRVGFTYLTTSPLYSVAPGMMITVAIMAFIVLGDGLRDALDPRIRGEGKKM